MLRVFSYRDIIVCAVSKGDLSKEIICAVVSPTSVRDACADVWVSGGAGGGPGSSHYKTGRSTKVVGIKEHDSSMEPSILLSYSL